MPFPDGNAVNVAVYSTRYGMQPGCVTWVGEDDYGQMLKDDLAKMGVDTSHVHVKRGVTAQTQVELKGNDRVLGDYTEGAMADFTLQESDFAWLDGYDIIHSAIWGHAESAFPRLHAAGKLTAFDFADKWDSPLWQNPAAASRFCLRLGAAGGDGVKGANAGDSCARRRHRCRHVG